MNSYYLVLSGFFAWFGVPMLTLLAAWWLSRRAGTMLQKVMSVIAALAVGTTLFVWLQWFHNPLPSDETLIKHFNEHRAEFEQLMKGARNYRAQVPRYEESAEGKVLAERLRVEDVGQGGSMSWLPDPYSEKTVRLLNEFNMVGLTLDEREKNRRTPQEMIVFWKTNLPELFEGMAPVTEVWQLNKLAGVIRVQAIRMEAPGIVRLGQDPHHLIKEYWHFPQPPRVENGWLLTPSCYQPDCFTQNNLNRLPIEIRTLYQDALRNSHVVHGRLVSQKSQRVIESLDTFPSNWKPGECVLKRIDPHWFLAMCKSA